MGLRLPSALAGNDNEVGVDEEGARKVAMMVGGTALAAGIIAAGGYAYQRVTEILGVSNNADLGDYY